MNQSLSDYAYQEIKSRILNGELHQGEAISINAISEELNISRTPVTNACQKLEYEKLLRILPKQGVVIHTISINEARGIYELRAAIESYNAKIVFPMITESDCLLLQDSIEKQRAFVLQNNARLFMEEDHRFHRFFLQKNINNELLSVINQLYDRAFMLGIMNCAAQRLSQSIAEHESILDSIRCGDAQTFSSSVEKNILNGFSALLSFSNRLS